jgi:hypothetical protein
MSGEGLGSGHLPHQHVGTRVGAPDVMLDGQGFPQRKESQKHGLTALDSAPKIKSLNADENSAGDGFLAGPVGLRAS